MAIRRLDRAKQHRGRVFFVLEGCLKADSILARSEAVASVPSISLWADAPELKPFSREYLKDVTTFVDEFVKFFLLCEVAFEVLLDQLLSRFTIGPCWFCRLDPKIDREPAYCNLGEYLYPLDEALSSSR